MTNDLDEVLRQLLTCELPIKRNEADVTFDLPKREWSVRLSRPALNFFLYDIRENTQLRQPPVPFQVERSDDGTVRQRRQPLRIDLRYMITAWANALEDEHRPFSRTLVLFRTPALPDDLLLEVLQDQPVPTTMQVAQYDTLDKPTDMWNALDNIMRLIIACVITLAMNLFRPFVTPMVRTRELQFRPPEDLISESRPTEPVGPDRMWTAETLCIADSHLKMCAWRWWKRDWTCPSGRMACLPFRICIAAVYARDGIIGQPPARHKITVQFNF